MAGLYRGQPASRWRKWARDRIDRELEGLASGVNADGARLALRRISPGSSPSWPYKCWLKECQLAIARRFPRESKRLTVHASRLGVWCDYCDRLNGCCLACANACEDFPPVEPILQELAEFLRMLAMGHDLAGHLADWLEEKAETGELANAVREIVKQHPRSLKQRYTPIVCLLGRYVPRKPT